MSPVLSFLALQCTYPLLTLATNLNSPTPHCANYFSTKLFTTPLQQWVFGNVYLLAADNPKRQTLPLWEL